MAPACRTAGEIHMTTRLLESLTQPSRRIVLLTCAVLFGLTALIALRGGDQLRYRDETDYDLLARHLAVGQGYINQQGRSTAYRPPGYPIFLAVLYQFWNRPLAAKLANAAMLAALGWLLAEMVASVAPQGKLFAPMLLLLYPVFPYTATTLYPQILGALLFAAVVLWLMRWPDAPFSAALCGTLLGALILVIPVYLLILPIIVGFLLIAGRGDLAHACRSVGLMALGVILVVCPWTIRNALLFHKIVPVSTNSGINLLLGNCADAGPNSGVNVDVSRYEKEVQGMNEAQADGHLKERAKQWIVNHPGAAAKLYILKVLNYFNFRNQVSVQAEASAAKNVAMFFSYYLLLGLGIIRCLLWRRYPLSRAEILCYVVYFSNAFLSAIFFTRIRFRVPFDILLIACDAILIGYLLSTWKSNNCNETSNCRTLQ
jgi:hypothetical protein